MSILSLKEHPEYLEKANPSPMKRVEHMLLKLRIQDSPELRFTPSPDIKRNDLMMK